MLGFDYRSFNSFGIIFDFSETVIAETMVNMTNFNLHNVSWSFQHGHYNYHAWGNLASEEKILSELDLYNKSSPDVDYYEIKGDFNTFGFLNATFTDD